MDPITTAIVTAIATNLGQGIVKDAYEALKAAIKQKFGNDSEVVSAVDGLEKKPDSAGRKTTLEEEVKNAKVSEDSEILQLAQELLKKINSEQTVTGESYQLNVGGDFTGVGRDVDTGGGDANLTFGKN
jgi:disulfide oxidoreductase YuzD